MTAAAMLSAASVLLSVYKHFNGVETRQVLKPIRDAIVVHSQDGSVSTANRNSQIIGAEDEDFASDEETTVSIPSYTVVTMTTSMVTECFSVKHFTH